MNVEKKIMENLHQRIGFERSTKAIMHILNGKRSSQTIQDIHLFSLEYYGGLLKSAPDAMRFSFEQRFEEYRKRQEMFSNQPKNLSESLSPISPYMNCMQYEWTGVAQLFFEGIALTVQSCSFLKVGESYFFPVSENELVQQQVKSLLKSGGDIHDVTSQIHYELDKVLTVIRNMDVTPFVLKLTAKDDIGFTYKQLAEAHQANELDIFVHIRCVLHGVLNEISSSAMEYPLLNLLLPDQTNQNPLFTVTANKTRQLLEKGCSLDQIARIRNLKLSTVEDHIAELAHADNSFDHRPYLTEEELRFIHLVIEEGKSTKLRELRDATEGNFSYLQLRIAMALSGGEHN